MIPWWFIEKAAQSAGFHLPPVICIGQPQRISLDTEKMIPELLTLGKSIYQWTELNENVAQKKIVVVISSDLSHYHSADPTSPYQFSEFAAEFDEYIKEWAQMDINSTTETESFDRLITKAGALANRVATCGYTGLVTLHGLLNEAVKRGFKYQSKFIYYSVPTYYGMMVNRFILHD